MSDALIKKLIILNTLLKADKEQERRAIEEALAAFKRGEKTSIAATPSGTKPPEKTKKAEEEDAADAYLKAAKNPQPEDKVDPDEIIQKEKTGERKYDNWKPIGPKNSAEKQKFDHYKSRGFSDREAEQLAGIDMSHTHGAKRNKMSTIKPSQPSQAMLDLVKPWAEEYHEKAKSMERRDAAPEKQPILYSQGQKDKVYKEHFDNYKDALKNFRNSDEYKKLNPEDIEDAEHDFKKKYHAQDPQKKEELYNKIGQAEASRGKALGARAEELAGIRQEIASGGASMGDTGGSSNEEDDIYDNGASGAMSNAAMAESLTGRKQSDSEKSSGISVGKNPIADFAAKHPEYVKHLNEKQKDRLNHTKAAKQRAMMATPYTAPEAEKEPTEPIATRQAGQLGEEEKQSQQRIHDAQNQTSKYSPEQQLASNHIVKDWLPFIQMHAFKLYKDKRIGKDDVEDMFDPGTHGLMQAIKDYNHDKATRFSSGQDQDKLFRKYAGTKVRGAMLSHLANKEVIPQHERVAAKKIEAQAKTTPPAEQVEPAPEPTTPPKVGE